MRIDLKVERVKLGLTQAEAAKSADVSTFTYQQIESGKGNPSANTIRKICAALGVNPEAIINS